MSLFSQMSGKGMKLDISSIKGAGNVIALIKARLLGQTCLKSDVGVTVSLVDGEAVIVSAKFLATSCTVASFPPNNRTVALSDCSSFHARTIAKFRSLRESSRMSLT